MDHLRRDDPSAVFAFRDFATSLDRSLRALAGRTPLDAPEIDPIRGPAAAGAPAARP
jgi:hypothetical protein